MSTALRRRYGRAGSAYEKLSATWPLYRVTGADGSTHDVRAPSADAALAAVVDMALFGMSRPVVQGTAAQAMKTAEWGRKGGMRVTRAAGQGRR